MAAETSEDHGAPTATFLENRVLLPEDYDEIYEERFGKPVENGLSLFLEEALYLVEDDELVVEDDGAELDAAALYERCTQVDNDFPQRYRVYKDLRRKGYSVKSGFKYGTHFRVYDKGVDPYSDGAKTQREHTKWVVQAVPEQYTLNYEEMARAVRLAQNIHATMLWAVVDAENDVTYYEFKRITP